MSVLDFFKPYASGDGPWPPVKPQPDVGHGWWDSIGKRDERTQNWLWVATPYPTIIISILYVFGVLFLLRFMRDREPYDLRTAIKVHNLFLILLSAWMSYTLITEAWALGHVHVFVCNKLDRTERGHMLARALHVFYLSKCIEMGDTVFMCLRKKTRQVSFLHVYHHFMTFLLWWIGAHFAAGGDSYFSAFLNTFVHVVMYTYYLAAAFDIQVPFKKYITQFQMFQFFLNICHCSIGAFTGCGTEDNPAWMYWGMIIYMISFLGLFYAFYRSTYGGKKGKKGESGAKSGKPKAKKAD